MKRKEQLSTRNILLLRQQAFVEEAFHYLEFGWEDAGRQRIFRADAADPTALKEARAALVEMLWTTKIDVGSDLISEIADHVRDSDSTEEDQDREKG